jgi:hypothetical protein
MPAEYHIKTKPIHAFTNVLFIHSIQIHYFVYLVDICAIFVIRIAKTYQIYTC